MTRLSFTPTMSRWCARSGQVSRLVPLSRFAGRIAPIGDGGGAAP
jgi:hypothetical protein